MKIFLDGKPLSIKIGCKGTAFLRHVQILEQKNA